ncbi:phage tail tube protein [Robertmurraya korlensis]|uniref:phage tail tube protein n=1 Tax=Robertmurraya korlensis TaxID=519977 RepID=UPI0020411135|nr:phage tail tube protein [Robertmurraya korlensis]MCM3599393.1 phage tail tube protein [Robertmurraya korlensis]
MTFKPEQAISGTYGEAWINGEKFAEVFGLQAKINILKEDVPMCGVPSGRGKKMMGWEGTGSVRFTKINSKLLKRQLDMLKQGKELMVTIVSKVKDPAALGAERVSIPNCTFDDITLADWENNTILREEKPFTFSDMPTLIDSIGR